MAMKQLTFSAFKRYGKTTRRGAFLSEMERVARWADMCALIEPFYPKPATGVRRWDWSGCRAFISCRNGSIFAIRRRGRALYHSATMRDFARIDLGREPAPDESTIFRLRHLLEAHDLGRRLFEGVHRHLEASGLKAGDCLL
jgi:transposase, IS5 family